MRGGGHTDESEEPVPSGEESDLSEPEPGWVDRWLQPPRDAGLSPGRARHIALLLPISASLTVAAFVAVFVASTPALGMAYATFAVVAGVGFALGQAGYGRLGSLATGLAPLFVPYAGFLHLVQGQSVIEAMWLALASVVGVLLLPVRWAVAWVFAIPLVSAALMASAGIPAGTALRVGGVLLAVGSTASFAAFALAHRDRLVARQQAAERAQQGALVVALADAEQAAKAKDRFLAVLTHELRTPLTGVLGGSRLLLEAPLTPEQRRTVEVIHSSGDSLLALIDDLLDVSRLSAGAAELEVEPVDPLGVVEEQLRALRTAGGNRVPVAYVGPSWLPMVAADRRRLGQVLANLLGNAAKHTRKGHIEVDAVVQKDRIGLFVRDTGPGIRVEDRGRIFEAFEQIDTRRGGAGLGLSIARGLLDAMGGLLELGPQPEAGACFRAWVPTAEGTPSSGDLDDLGGSALVVHPLQPVRAAVARWLEGWGYDVVQVENMRLGGECMGTRPFDVLVISERMSLSRVASPPGHRVWIGLDRAPPGEVCIDAICMPGDLRAALLEDHLVDPDSGTTRTPTPAPVRARVLLAEDNAVNRMVLRGMLGNLGCEVQAVENGALAVEAVSDGRFDLVLMDCQMPEMDGFSAAAAVGELPGAPPVVALTASASDDVRERCREAGMVDFLTKPVSLETLRAAIARHRRSGT